MPPLLQPVATLEAAFSHRFNQAARLFRPAAKRNHDAKIYEAHRRASNGAGAPTRSP